VGAPGGAVCGEGRAWLGLGMVGKPSCPAGQVDLFQKTLPGRRGTVQVRVCGVVEAVGKDRGKAGGHAISNVSCWPPSGPLYVAGMPLLLTMPCALWRSKCLGECMPGSCCMSCWGISNAPSTENSNVPQKNKSRKVTHPFLSPVRSLPNRASILGLCSQPHNEARCTLS